MAEQACERQTCLVLSSGTLDLLTFYFFTFKTSLLSPTNKPPFTHKQALFAPKTSLVFTTRTTSLIFNQLHHTKRIGGRASRSTTLSKPAIILLPVKTFSYGFREAGPLCDLFDKRILQLSLSFLPDSKPAIINCELLGQCCRARRSTSSNVQKKQETEQNTRPPVFFIFFTLKSLFTFLLFYLFTFKSLFYF